MSQTWVWRAHPDSCGTMRVSAFVVAYQCNGKKQNLQIIRPSWSSWCLPIRSWPLLLSRFQAAWREYPNTILDSLNILHGTLCGNAVEQFFPCGNDYRESTFRILRSVDKIRFCFDRWRKNRSSDSAATLISNHGRWLTWVRRPHKIESASDYRGLRGKEI